MHKSPFLINGDKERGQSSKSLNFVSCTFIICPFQTSEFNNFSNPPPELRSHHQQLWRRPPKALHPSSARQRYLSQGKTTFHSLKKKTQVKGKKKQITCQGEVLEDKWTAKRGDKKRCEKTAAAERQQERSPRQPRRNRRDNKREEGLDLGGEKQKQGTAGVWEDVHTLSSVGTSRFPGMDLRACRRIQSAG